MRLFSGRGTALWAWARERPSLWGVYAVFAVVAARLNPLRFVFNDDDFAYARMTQHLLRTGQYKPDNWTAANLPFQTLWGALFSLPFGYSPGALKMSTIAVFMLALGCLYQLLRDHEVGEQEAGLLTFVFMASPMVLQLAFSFMTDLHYLSWLVIALFFYARAFAARSDPDDWAPLALGGVAAFAAVGTRQIGAALVGAVGALWLFDPDRVKRLPRYVFAVALPMAALVWQYRLLKTQPTFSQTVRLVEQAAYLDNREGLKNEVWWRPTVMLQYVGWFLWPLFPVFLVHWSEATDRLRSAVQRARPVRPLLFAAAVWLFYRGNVDKDPGKHLMPSLPWLMNGIEGAKELDYRYRLHHATCVFGVLVLWLLLRRFVPQRGHPGTSNTDKLLGLVTAGMMVGNIIFFVLGDRYSIVYIPLCLWLLGRTAGRWPAWTRALVLVLGFYSLSSSMRWTQRRLEPETSYWALGEIARARGAGPRDVSESWQWHNYYGAYDEFAASVAGRKNVNLDEIWGFLNRRNAAARYLISDTEPAPDAVVVAVREWKDPDGKPHHSWLIDRRPEEPHL